MAELFGVNGQGDGLQAIFVPPSQLIAGTNTAAPCRPPATFYKGFEMARYQNGEKVVMGDEVVLRGRVVGLHQHEPYTVTIESVEPVPGTNNTISVNVSSKQIEKSPHTAPPVDPEGTDWSDEK